MADNAVTKKPRVFSGIQPSGFLNLGTYIGAIRNWVAMLEDYDNIYCIVDMHAITVRQDPKELKRRSLLQLAQFIACGLDPARCTLFIQSHVPAHAELAWLLGCFAMYGELGRMTQFKEKSQKNEDNINVGLFAYPVLMAADILLYQAERVPVGDDQKQHVELARNIVQRVNGVYEGMFTMPEPFIPKLGARIMSLTNPTAKMSKSDDDPRGSIFLHDTEDEIMAKFKRAVTDSEAVVRYSEGRHGINNLMTIYSVTSGRSFEAIEAEFDGRGYGDFKRAVGESVAALLRPIREEAARLLADRAYLEGIYAEGARKAAYMAAPTLAKFQKKLGFIPRPV